MSTGSRPAGSSSVLAITIIPWNAVYLTCIVNALRAQG
jgi:hypothetical protein